MTKINDTNVAATIAGLDRWFDAMRVDWPTSGYGGPVVHWWNHSLVYQGTGLDWRYEGIVDGYLTLHRKTGDPKWLEKAIRAGWDLVNGQLKSGHFRRSGFERNPEIGGTPHEAAADVALLLLAKELRDYHPDLSARFLDAARRNLQTYWLGRLWHDSSATLWDRPGVPSFVPNKAATFIDAIILLSDLTGDAGLVERYARPTGERILEMQVNSPGETLDGALAQNWFKGRVTFAYFPLYNARCVPPLLRLAEMTSDLRFREAALAATRFLVRVREADGGFPQVLYANRRVNRYPRWIAGAGDIVRAMWWANASGEVVDCGSTLDWIMRGTRSDGRIASAEGFGRIVPVLSRRDRFADEVGVVGWCDKAFRALVTVATPSALSAPAGVAARAEAIA